MGAHAFLADVDGAHVGILAQAVGRGRTTDLRDDLAHYRVIYTEHRQTVERQVVEELDKGLLQLAEVAAIGAHVVGIDIGDHGHHRLQVQEAGVALVGLGDQVATAAQLRVGAGRREPATDDKGRVQPTCGKYRGQQAGGGRLAVGTGDRDAMAITHQLSKHLARGTTGMRCSSASATSGLEALIALDTTSTSAPATLPA